MFYVDDVGSFPLPNGLTRIGVEEAAKCFSPTFLSVLEEVMLLKLEAGVERPSYPQLRDMVDQFLQPIKEHEEEVCLIRKSAAKIPEVEALTDFCEQRGVQLRVCVTGPVELYLRFFAPPLDEGLLLNLARSVGRFVQSAVEKGFVRVVSLDEPSLGLDPRLSFEGAGLVLNALELAAKPAARRGLDVQLHLHSTSWFEELIGVEGINILGFETAADPTNLEALKKDLLEAYDKFARVGIARTDYGSLLAQASGRSVLEVETEELMEKRLEKAWRGLGERIRYVGPDCGLGSWPDQRSAFRLLEACCKAAKEFRSKLE